MLRLLPATAGSVIFNGTDVLSCDASTMKSLRREMQIVFQKSVRKFGSTHDRSQIVAEPLEVHKVASGKDLKEKVYSLVELVGLSREMADRYPHEFSGGQRQRVGIARGARFATKIDRC